MTYKKNWLSVCLWAFYALAVFLCYAKALYDVLQAPHVKNHYIQFGIVFLSLALVTAVFIRIRKLANLLKRPVHVLWEALIFILLFAAGVFFRIYFIGSGAENAAYFETAMVNGSPVPTLAHGAQYFYVLLLRGLFLLTGNRFMAGIVLQICLQILAAVVWYLAVKRISGRTAALVLFGGLMIMPASIREGLLYSPKMLYMLLCGIVLLMLGSIAGRQYRNKPLKWYAWLLSVLAGVGIGLLTYLDVSGALFIVPALFLPLLNGADMGGEAPSGKKRLGRAVLQLFLILLFAFGAMFLLLYMDALQSGEGISKVFATWSTLFSYKGVQTVFPTVFIAKTLLEAWAFVALTFVMLIGVLAFFVRRKEEIQMQWLFFALAAAALYVCRFYADGMDCEYMLLVAALLLAGAGLQAAFCKTENLTEQEEEEAPAEEEKEAQSAVAQENPAAAANGKEAQPAAAKENPAAAADGKEAQPETAKENPAAAADEKEAQSGEAEKPQSEETAKENIEGEKPNEQAEVLEEKKESEQQSPERQNQTESDVSQMNYNSEHEGGSAMGEQDSLWALFAGDDGAAKPNEPEKSGGKKSDAKKAKEKKGKEEKVKEEKVKEKKVKEKKTKEKPPKKSAEKKNAAEPAIPKAEEKAEDKKNNYIENPLPLPKKHVKKSVSYHQTELTPDKMDFDIDISEFDDFDI